LFYSTSVLPKEITEFAKNEISTKNGSKTSLVLPDGTKVWLNASSELTYEKNYGNKLREVTLSGEAYFDVVKNKEKPFIIHTSKMDIKVLGTVFNVKCYPGEKTTETSLVRGSIEVTLKDRVEKIMLKPNEKLIINNADDIAEKNKIISRKVAPSKTITEKPIISLTHLTMLPVDNTIIETAWVQNRLVFSSETFEEVVLKMERWYNVKIFIMDESLKEERLTGNFEKETIADALNALKLTTKFSYNIVNNNSIQIYKSDIVKK
jgi:ferric-dicitrate binding protein FerR (iron transport regulator)